MSDIPKRCPTCGQFTERPCPKCMGRGWVDSGYSEGQPTTEVQCLACNGAGLVAIGKAVRDE